MLSTYGITETAQRSLRCILSKLMHELYCSKMSGGATIRWPKRSLGETGDRPKFLNGNTAWAEGGLEKAAKAATPAYCGCSWQLCMCDVVLAQS